MSETTTLDAVLLAQWVYCEEAYGASLQALADCASCLALARAVATAQPVVPASSSVLPPLPALPRR